MIKATLNGSNLGAYHTHLLDVPTLFLPRHPLFTSLSHLFDQRTVLIIPLGQFILETDDLCI
jgi:hypothetical protein